MVQYSFIHMHSPDEELVDGDAVNVTDTGHSGHLADHIPGLSGKVIASDQGIMVSTKRDLHCILNLSI